MTLKRLGWSQVERSGLIFLIHPPVRVVYGTNLKDHYKLALRRTPEGLTTKEFMWQLDHCL